MKKKANLAAFRVGHATFYVKGKAVVIVTAGKCFAKRHKGNLENPNFHNGDFKKTIFFQNPLTELFYLLFKKRGDFAPQIRGKFRKENLMIGTATQKGSRVDVYDENGHFLFSKNGELQGFTGATVSIRSGNRVEVYDDRGHFKFSK